MNIDRIYNICLGFILVTLFFGAYFFGNAMEPKGEKRQQETKETSFSVEPADKISSEPLPLSKIPEPKEVEECDYTVSEYYYDIALDDVQQDYVFELCTEYDLPCELVFAVMGVESSYIDSRISSNGDYGIMQINSINHQWLKDELGVDDFLDFKDNVLCGVYMLSDYYHRYVDFNKIAMCYRYGENAAKRMWEQGISETDYTRQIVRSIATLKYR